MTTGLGRKDRLHLLLDGTEVLAVIEWGDTIRLTMTGEGGAYSLSVQDIEFSDGAITGVYGGQPFSAVYEASSTGDRLSIVTGDRVLVDVGFQDLLAREEGAGAGGRLIRAPMSGRLIKLAVRTGDQVQPGQQVAILEAMKMEHALSAGLNGKVIEIGAKEGDQVEEGQLLVMLETSE